MATGFIVIHALLQYGQTGVITNTTAIMLTISLSLDLIIQGLNKIW